MHQYQLTFIDLALRREALRFGTFTLKSGRESPYFFNAGLFSDGEAAHVLGQLLCRSHRAGPAWQFDMLFGPAYKGIPLATATAVALAAGHGTQRALRLQPQGGQGARRGRSYRGRRAQGTGADRGRRHHRGHGGARVARDHPRRAAPRRPASHSRSTGRSAAAAP